MSPKDKKLVLAGFAICLVIAVLSPFMASSNPDGLEKTAELVSTTDESGIYNAPFADYTISMLGDGPFLEVIALVIGVILTLVAVYIVAMILRMRTPPKSSK